MTTLRLWDLDTPQCIRVFEGQYRQAQQALFLPPEIGCGHLLEPGALVNDCAQRDMESIRVYYGKSFSADPGRSLPPLYVISGSLDGTLRLWNTASGAGDLKTKVLDAITGDCLMTLAGHTEPVTSIGLTDSIIATGGDDSRIFIYDFNPKESRI